MTSLTDGQTLSNVQVDDLVVSGNNVRVSNVQVGNGNPSDSILVTGDDVVLDHISTASIAVSSGMRTTIQYSNLSGTEGDGFHVTSDRGRHITGTKLLYNYVHGPIADSGEHADGVQVRGANDMLIHCNAIDAGPYVSRFNASVYLEDANGGNANVSVTNNWLYGYAWGIMLGTGSAFTVSGNHFGGDIHWDYCYMNVNTMGPSFSAQNNVDDRTGRPVQLPGVCKS